MLTQAIQGGQAKTRPWSRKTEAVGNGVVKHLEKELHLGSDMVDHLSESSAPWQRHSRPFERKVATFNPAEGMAYWGSDEAKQREEAYRE
jgi:hypothetical protein